MLKCYWGLAFNFKAFHLAPFKAEKWSRRARKQYGLMKMTCSSKSGVCVQRNLSSCGPLFIFRIVEEDSLFFLRQLIIFHIVAMVTPAHRLEWRAILSTCRIRPFALFVFSTLVLFCFTRNFWHIAATNVGHFRHKYWRQFHTLSSFCFVSWVFHDWCVSLLFMTSNVEPNPGIFFAIHPRRFSLSSNQSSLLFSPGKRRSVTMDSTLTEHSRLAQAVTGHRASELHGLPHPHRWLLWHPLYCDM